MTLKEQNEKLLIEITKLRESRSGWVSGDEIKRKEISNILRGNYKKNGLNYLPKETRIYSWYEICAKIGKLKEAKRIHLMEEEFEGLIKRVSGLEYKINELKINKEEQYAQRI